MNPNIIFVIVTGTQILPVSEIYIYNYSLNLKHILVRTSLNNIHLIYSGSQEESEKIIKWIADNMESMIILTGEVIVKILTK